MSKCHIVGNLMPRLIFIICFVSSFQRDVTKLNETRGNAEGNQSYGVTAVQCKTVHFGLLSLS